jgi:hypothetical protein
MFKAMQRNCSSFPFLSDVSHKYVAFLKEVTERTAKLVSWWQVRLYLDGRGDGILMVVEHLIECPVIKTVDGVRDGAHA